jgi:N-methylhydantoinase B
MVSLGKGIRREYRNQGCFRMLTIQTKEGTIVHPTIPATHGNSTNYIAQQIIDAVSGCLSQAMPQEVSAGWGHIGTGGILSGIDPRSGKRFASPNWPSSAVGAGAIWGTDGWHTAGAQICSGSLWFPEFEIFEKVLPMVWERWEFAQDSCGPGKWRGGCGVHNVLMVDTDSIPITVTYGGDIYNYEVTPAILGGGKPMPNSIRFLFKDGHCETIEDIRRKLLYQLYGGDVIACLAQGGCGVGDPLERDIEAVREDVRNEIISLESASEDYGVIINGVTFDVDKTQTEKRRKEMKSKKKE